MVVATVIAALVLGFLAGLFAFKVKTRWCPGCGETLTCIRCEEVGSSGAPRSARRA